MLNGVGNAAAIGADHGCAGRARLHQHQAKAFEPQAVIHRRQGEDISRREPGAHQLVIDESQNWHMVAQTQFVDAPLDLARCRRCPAARRP